MRYMIVTYIKRPDGKYDELTEFKSSVRLKHYQSAKVILDFKKKQCLKNGLSPQASYQDMIDFYKKMLGDRLTPYLPKD